MREIDDLIVIIMIRDSVEVERKFLNWGIPFVTGFELLVEMSLGKIITSEYFAKNTILEVYDLLETEAKETYVELMANRLAPELAKKSYCDLYFPCAYFNEVYFPVAKESFVDCGAYDGDTIRELLKVDKNVTNIYSFELDSKNYEDLSMYVSNLPEELHNVVKLYHVGVWDERKVVQYGNEEKSDNVSYSILKSVNTQEVCVERLDDILKEKDITFIKMDVEGSELPALRGSEHIIRMQKPKLAICVYHKIEDFWEIPMYLHSLVPEYHFGILHHDKDMLYESVLYAWI